VEISKSSGIYTAALNFLRSYNGKLSEKEQKEILHLVSEAFLVSEEELLQTVTGASKGGLPLPTTLDPKLVEEQGRHFAPDGIVKKYIDYTAKSEPPISYHLFCCLAMIGATLGRRVFFDMAHFRIYPPLGVILVGESGLKKTTATDIAIDFLREGGYTQIYAEKCTPEYLADSMKDFAQGVIYAPEMSVFLGRQRYMEGAVQLIARLLDCPKVLELGTIVRKSRVLREVAVTTLFCSVPIWLVSGCSEDIFTGGFMARHLIVMQYGSSRVERRPTIGDPGLRNSILTDLCSLLSYSGELTLTPEADHLYDLWYNELKKKTLLEEHEIMRTYFARKHVPVHKIAANYHLTRHGGLEICKECFQLAIDLLEWNEQFLPPLMQTLFRTQDGMDQAFILRLIQSNGGLINHTELVRRAEYRMRAKKVNDLLQSLIEGQRIEEKKTGFYHVYVMKGGA